MTSFFPLWFNKKENLKKSFEKIYIKNESFIVENAYAVAFCVALKKNMKSVKFIKQRIFK